ncbi:hypothetical protein Taro_056180 [Colocasia esculenta]|uniref:Uncharacterized protein n=1 Tax=Colocasia esculenta TaxID=4460 RepID=A0A843XSU6_COLES|nr:hypothetical protein [Colocasia esculenta]
MISPIPRFFGSSVSIDYVNRWQNPHAQPPSHSDRKSCSTRHEISSPVATPSIMRMAGRTHTRSRPVTAIGSRVQLNARSPPQRLHRLRESLAEPTRGAAQSQRSEVVINSTRDLLPRHSEALDAALLPLAIRLRFGVEKPSFRTPKLRFYPTISPIPRFFGSSDSIVYANRWRKPHAEPPSHSDRKSCSTRREISSAVATTSIKRMAGRTHMRSLPVTVIGSRVQLDARSPPQTPIRNRHSEALDAALLPLAIRLCFGVEKPSFCTPKLRFYPTISLIPRFFGSRDSIDYANRWQNPHAEPPGHSDRKSCSTRREISSPGRGYGCPNIADIVTPSAKELGITFRTGIGIVYVTTIRNRHSKTVDRALVRRIPFRGKNSPRSVCTSTPTVVRSGRTRIFIRPGVGTPPRGPNSESALRPGQIGTQRRSTPSFQGRKTFVSHSEIAILADDLRYSKRLHRLRELLAEPTRGAAQSTAIGSRVQLDARSPSQVVDMGARTSPI